MQGAAAILAFVLLFGCLVGLLVAADCTAPDARPASAEAIDVYDRYLREAPEHDTPVSVLIRDVVTDKNTKAILSDESHVYVDRQRRNPEEAAHYVGETSIPDDQTVTYATRERYQGRLAYRLHVRHDSPALKHIEELLIEEKTLALREWSVTYEYTLPNGNHVKRVARLYDFGKAAP